MEKRTLKKTYELDRLTISVFSVSFGHGHLQYAVARWEERACLLDHVYSIPYYVTLEDATNFEYDASFSS